MKKYLSLTQIILPFVISLCLVSYTKAQEGVGMVTGSTTGTYIQFGNEIADVTQKAGLNIIVKDSEGSIANIKRLTSRENAALAIVQSDVLGFLGRSNNPKMVEVARKIRLIFPFYNEEVHLFARKEIQSFTDLEGKRLVLGAKGSGNWLTANNLLQMTGVKPSEYLYLSPSKAVTAVLTGEADAMIYVAGKPVKLFKNIEKLKSKPDYAPLLEKVHFAKLDDQKMLQEYAGSQISVDDYAWFDSSIPTIAVKAVLISFDFSRKKNAYFRQRCQQLSTLGQAIRDNIDQLKESGHPKWKEVDLNARIGIWELDTCSRKDSNETPDPKANIARELEKFLVE